MSIDMNKYDRMLRTYGLSATQLLQSGCVYIVGLKRGFAGEICKNLALSGINTIYLVGTDIVDSLDIKSSMYYKKEGDKCSHILLHAIKELNSTVSVYTCDSVFTCDTGDSIENLIPNSVVVSINSTIQDTISINNICRQSNCAMVHVMSSGLAGSIFVDCITTTVMDATGSIHEPIQIKDIVSNGTIFCNSHDLSIGDLVRFTMIEGKDVDFLLSKNWKVIDTNYHSIKIELPESLDNFKFINGVMEYVPQPTIFKHKPLSEFETFAHETKMLDCVLSNKECDKEYMYTRNLVFEPVTSLIGGFASNEVIKLISHKYTPLEQFITWSDFNVIGDVYSSEETVINASIDILARLKELNILMVGCGALGCEWLKNMAMLGCGEKGSIDIVDPDHIEHSNLSRQFLFRPFHVKQSKCKVAKDMIRVINGNMNISTYEHKLSSENIELTQKVFANKDIVINCLDNIEARRYVDKNCFEYSLPLFESGTMGMKGNTMPIIPFITETYSNMSDPAEEKQFPVCTIKHFPNQILHTIHWARDNFELYNRGPMNCNKYTLDKNYLEGLSLVERNQAIQDINYFLFNPPSTWLDTIEKARASFEHEFNHTIKQLLHCFPKDHTINGQLFWSHGKICPDSLDISLDRKDTLDYIYSTCKLLCRVYNILDQFTIDDVIQFLNDFPERFKMNEFIPKDMTIAKDDAELNKTIDSSVVSEININSNMILYPQEFEKDDDTNGHIDYITSASNCRAKNYRIIPATRYETKGIAGRIIPAVATTTSTVVGLIGMELLRYVAGHKKCSDYRSWFMNMADNMVLYSEPIEMPSINIGKTKINGWTKFNYNIIEKSNSTLKELVDFYEKLFETKIYMILYGSAILYLESSDSINSRLIDIFSSSYDIDIIQNRVTITLISEDSNIELPPIIL